MRRHAPSFLLIAGIAAGLVAPRRSAACMVNLSASALTDPARVVGSTVLIPGTTPSPLRPTNLTPLGVNFSDCVQGTVLRFQLTAASCGDDDVQVWATNLGASACISPSARGADGSSPTCWLVSPVVNGANLSMQPPLAGSGTGLEATWDISVPDIVGPQGGSIPAAGTVSSFDISGCFTQPSTASSVFSILFLPVLAGTNTYDSSATASAQAYQYLLPVDLVGPAAPLLTSEPAASDGTLTLSWAANTDSDTYG